MVDGKHDREHILSAASEELDVISWQMLEKAAQHKDKDFVAIFIRLQRIADNLALEVK